MDTNFEGGLFQKWLLGLNSFVSIRGFADSFRESIVTAASGECVELDAALVLL
jgi:hypothetical protein